MTDEVFTIVESHKHEGSRLKDVISSESEAHKKVEDLCEEHPFQDGEWDTWQTDNEQHVQSYQNGNITYVIKRWDLT